MLRPIPDHRQALFPAHSRSSTPLHGTTKLQVSRWTQDRPLPDRANCGPSSSPMDVPTPRSGNTALLRLGTGGGAPNPHSTHQAPPSMATTPPLDHRTLTRHPACVDQGPTRAQPSCATRRTPDRPTTFFRPRSGSLTRGPVSS